ncbi:MAG: hypothetical protein K6T49_04825 [Acidobacterium ailaaui]|nr:hypothetical protein [Pseudacidobacterium ailaaui]
MQADSIAEGHPVWTEAEKRAVLEQVERLLASPYFSHSRRFPTFLRFVTQQTLAGETELLKERTLGIEIFGRAPDYDTSSDPIVRVTAAEIRKRIAQYYQEPGHEEEVRVLLPAGSYVPQFQWVQKTGEAQHTEPERHDAPAAEGQASPERRDVRQVSRWTAGIVLASLLAFAAGLLWRAEQHSPLDVFWGPVLHSQDPVLLCIADQNQYSVIALRDATDPSRQSLLKDNLSAVVMDDVSAIVKIAGLMQANGRKYSLKGEGTTELSDLRNGPTVFIGAFDNAWTLRLTQSLRYHFGNNAEMTKFWIADAASKQPPVWLVDRTQQEATNNYRDYAIVARFLDTTTGKLAIVAAGIARGGTIAAGEFLTTPAYLNALAKGFSAGSSQNMEIVLSTEIIGGQPGTPRIEAAYFW